MPEGVPKLAPSLERMLQQVASKQDRMMRARMAKSNLWSSIAILGVVGWSVALPTLAGVALGVWIDHHWPSRFSWSLILLLAGLLLGCLSAWVRLKGDRS